MTKLPGAIAGARIVAERFAGSQRQQNPEGRMPFIDHIRELRNRVVKAVLALVAGMTAGFIFSTRPGTSSSARCARRLSMGTPAAARSASTSSSSTGRSTRSTYGSKSP
jgi:hypothetical protein